MSLISDFGFRISTARQRSGQAVITTLVFFLFVSVSLLASFASIALRETAVSRVDVRAKQSYFLAEAGLEDVVWRIRSSMPYAASQSVALDGLTAAVVVSDVGSQKTVTAQGNVSSAIRSIEVVLNAETGISFPYAVQVGQGGFFMENNSTVVGSVYSSGNITGQNTPEITGDAFAAATAEIMTFPDIGGNARAYRITTSAIGGSATSTTSISGSTVGINAYADTVTGSTVNGRLSYCASESGNTIGIPPATASCPPPASLPTAPLPISDEEIADWEAAAAAGGTHTSPCPYVLDDGTTPLGPKKINCDMTLKNDAIVVLDGPLWVVGNLTIENSAQLKLNTSYGERDEVVIVDNPMDRTTASKVLVQGSAQILGSGSSGSYVVLISQNNSAEGGGSEIAIQPKNFTSAAAYYAGHGMILIENNTVLKGATAYRIHMKNSAQLTYEIGLTNLNITAGPGGSWSIRGWGEVK